MTTCYHIQPLHFKDNINYSYVNRVTVDKTDNVEFIYQFVNINYCIPNEYNSDTTFVNYKITEPPTKVTKHEDFKERTYGSLKHTPFDAIPRSDIVTEIPKQYINIEFYEACYPIKLSLYGPILDDYYSNEIWAQKSDDQWVPILAQSWETILSTSQRKLDCWLSCDFKTKKFKLESTSVCSQLIMNIQINAVILIGTLEYTLSKSPKQSLNILQLQENFNKYCITCKSDIINSFYKSELGSKQMLQISRKSIVTRVSLFRQIYIHRFLKSLENCSNFKKCEKDNQDIKSYSDESKERSSCNFSTLSDEMTLKILNNLDVTSLSRMSRVNKRFNNLSRDPLLYKYLNLRNIHFSYMHIDVNQLFDYFTPRCKYLRHLDLTLCKFSTLKFREFLKHCCKHLTHLSLSQCRHIGDNLRDISEICKNLKELDLNYCRNITNKNILYLKNLQCLESLNIADLRVIQADTLCKILQKNREMRDLNLGGTHLNIDAIATKLQNSCLNLERLNLKCCSFTSQSIDAFAKCNKMKEINFSRCDLTSRVNGDIFDRLFSSCQYLEKIDLSYSKGFTKRDYETLTLCKNLKFLNLESMDVTPDICSQLFVKCPKLNELNVAFCKNISEDLVDQWNENFNVTVVTHERLSTINSY
ncbi:PREDICTED: uncharacterized protein LOC105453121 [Wasmannia auropunctata]|uniref:uncharacterized protein LOC105453121 n=1 Tax=Wasmannia auropunctata TaxID=64793 RepID=UPI0005EF098A|nr:PREDICTED: uncharacterized protein LOC105453121 [Wasmannia auropunctata]